MCYLEEKKKKLLLNSAEEIQKISKYFENKINEDNINQRICYRIPKPIEVDQLGNVFEFNFETNNEKDFAKCSRVLRC